MRKLGKLLSGLALIALGWFAAHALPAIGADPQASKGQPLVGPPASKDEVLAVVNGEPITRQELGDELIKRFGKNQLELLINRRIIQQEAKKHGITVTEKEIEDDIRDVMKLGQFPTLKDFEEMFLMKEKNCTLYEYKEDVVRPGIVMKKIAGQRLNVGEDEVKQAYQARWGERVQCRLIFYSDLRTANNTYGNIIRSGEGIQVAFDEFARSQPNVDLAAKAGEIAPIGRDPRYGAVAEEVFKLKDGQLSKVLQVPGGYAILLREKAVPPDDKHPYEAERDKIRVEVLEKKMRAEVPKLFKELKDRYSVQNFYAQKSSEGFIGAIEQSRKETGPIKNQ